MRYCKIPILLAFTLLLFSCNSSEPDIIAPLPTSDTTCTSIDTTGTGDSLSWQGQLPTGELPFSTIVITQNPRGLISEFEETTGSFSYSTISGSRVPDKISYELRNANDQVIEYRDHYLIFDPLRIMPLGDSITHGVDFHDGVDNPPIPQRVGYRKALYESLLDTEHVVDFTGRASQQAGFDVGLADADNNGYPGVDIPFVELKVYELLDEAPSDVILLHIGTNATPTTADGILEILDEIDRWSSTNFPVQVLVSSIVPERDSARQLDADAFNNDLRRLIALRSQSTVTLVENALALSVEDISLEDAGVHPSPTGYQRMADTWFEVLSEKILASECTNTETD